jgi:hypothetical protein
VTFDLTGQPGNEASAKITSTASGVTSTALTRASTLTPIAGSDSINSSDWTKSSSADPTRYYSFSVTAPKGCTLSLASLSIDLQASGTGPSKGDIATSADSYAKHTTSFSGSSNGTRDLSSSGTGTIEIRVYGYDASSTAGTFRIADTLKLSGSLM